MSTPTTTFSPHVGDRIRSMRGMRLILDFDLADLYGISTKALLQAVRRNPDRFPSEFLVVLDNQDVAILRSQIVTSRLRGHGGRRYAIRAFTEHGAVMAATVLDSPRAIAMSIVVVRAFVEFRQSLATHADLAKRLDELEQRVTQKLGMQDEAIADLLEAIRLLMSPPDSPPGRPIGFIR